MKRARVLAICQACPDNFKARHCITEDFEIDTHIEINDQDIPQCVYDQIRKLASIVEPNTTPMQHNATESNATLRLGVYATKIKAFLDSHQNEEFNTKTLSDKLEIPSNILRVNLIRLKNAGIIWHPQRGFYSAKCNLNHHQIGKIERDEKICVHNIDVKIPKNSLPDIFNPCCFPPTGGGNATLKNDPESNTNATESNRKQQEATVIEIAPNQSITIQETPDNWMVLVEASENPLDHREFRWLSVLLLSIFGKAINKGIIMKLVKIDLNSDIQTTYSPGQTTFGDLSGNMLAVYGKGDKTRIELRNVNPDLDIWEFAKKMEALFRPENQIVEAIKAPKTEKKVIPPITEFRTGLQILVDRGGVEALEEMRRKYREQLAAAEL
jgi:hypothetical protein